MTKKPSTAKEYEQLGKVVASIFESGYLDKKQAYKTSFIKGVIGGLGGVIGATLLVALLLWFLSIFSSVPLLGRFVDKIDHTINNSTRN